TSGRCTGPALPTRSTCSTAPWRATLTRCPRRLRALRPSGTTSLTILSIRKSQYQSKTKTARGRFLCLCVLLLPRWSGEPPSRGPERLVDFAPDYRDEGVVIDFGELIDLLAKG